jgi:hypothetical protein
MISLAALAGTGGTHLTAGHLSDVKDVAGIVGSAVTALAVIVGGSWAYFKFVKGRTYRPRLEVNLFGQWREVNGAKRYHARITVRNIGASVVRLLQRGTGLRVNLLADYQPRPPGRATWRKAGTFQIFLEHDWIEPGETVSDDLLLDLGESGPALVMLEARLVWKWSSHSEEIVVFARRMLAADSASIDS